MTEGFKKWLCEKSRVPYMASDKLIKEFQRDELTIMIKAMWAINRGDDCLYRISQDNSNNYAVIDNISIWKTKTIEYFLKNEYNNSEQKALEAALKYVYEQEKK
jgi:hypothetical protein